MWNLYRVVLRVRSPLHVGYLKVGPLMRTRLYVPGKTVWGAITAALALQHFKGDFDEAKKETKHHLAFSYFYPALEPEYPLWPCYAEGGLCYGERKMPAAELERRLLLVYGSTALDYSCNTALDGGLHEVEFISPYDLREGRPILLVGYICERQGTQLPWQDVLESIRLGGERKYGWGQVSVERRLSCADTIFGLGVRLSEARPRVCVPRGQPVLAHTPATAIEARGQIEPLVARETHDAAHYGGSFAQEVPICWVPGSVSQSEQELEISAYGLWCRDSGPGAP